MSIAAHRAETTANVVEMQANNGVPSLATDAVRFCVGSDVVAGYRV